jgi:hypothetical protein
MTDAEIQMWIDAAKCDMRRCGVKQELLVEETMSSLAKSAVVCFVKGQYGYDNSEAPRFLDSYRIMVTGLLNSKANEYLFPEDPDGSPSDDSNGEPDGSSDATGGDG